MSYNTGNNFGQDAYNTKRNQPRMSPFFPLLFAVMLAIGVLLGYNIQPGGGIGQKFSPNGKLNYLIGLIEEEYVDSVNTNDLTDKAIVGMLAELDPHSVYLTAKDAKQSTEELSGKFGGVGIQFLVSNDTVIVTHLVPNGPAEKKGVKAFDRIVKVNNKTFTKKGINENDVRNNLRGDVGSHVSVTFYRASENKTYTVDLNRGIIPDASVECGIMLNNEVGLIQISNFGENTFTEFLTEAKKLKSQGMKKMILDLRDNGGGYLQAAQHIADQFLKRDVKIVYTIGKKQGRYDYVATSNGEYEDMPLVVLVNQNSASASEIVAGAIQDNDRGVIVGRRTYGKGLVQQSFGTFNDGSALRLTVSRYYTPSGRCIQRPYGNGIDYFHDGYERYKNKEYYMPDSSRLAKQKQYKTLNKKRIVYGGGGIMPDYFVPYDTSYYSVFFRNVVEKNSLNIFALNYAERNGKEVLNKYKTPKEFSQAFEINETLWAAFLRQTKAQGVAAPTPEQETISKKQICSILKAEISSLVYNTEGFYMVRMLDDNEVKKAITSFWK